MTGIEHLTELDVAEIRVRMTWAAYQVHPTPWKKNVHAHAVGRVVTLRERAAFDAKITKAGTSGPRYPRSTK